MIFLIPFFFGYLLLAIGVILVAMASLLQMRTMTLGQRLRAWVKVWGITTFVFCGLLGLTADSMQLSYGGSTVNGKIENGVHFLGDHGNYTEVSTSTWDFIRSMEALGARCAWIGLLGIATFFIIGSIERRFAAFTLEEGFLPDA